MAAGLAVLHQHRPRPVVHRDLKGTNVLLTRPDASGIRTAKVADFGLSSFATATVSSRSTRATVAGGSMAGTLGWKAPETYRASFILPSLPSNACSADVVTPLSVLLSADTAAATTESDMFSFGMLLYEAIEKRLPFAGVSEGKILGMMTERFKYNKAFADHFSEKAQFAAWAKENPLHGRRPRVIASTPWSQHPTAVALGTMMQQCWQDQGSARPRAIDVLQQVKELERELAAKSALQATEVGLPQTWTVGDRGLLVMVSARRCVCDL